MAISLITRTASYREPVDGTTDKYLDVRGDYRSHTMGVDNPGMFDGMLAMQSVEGTISWTTLTPTIAMGTAYNTAHGGHDRHLVIDTDNADVLAVISAINWVNEA